MKMKDTNVTIKEIPDLNSNVQQTIKDKVITKFKAKDKDQIKEEYAELNSLLLSLYD